MVRVGLGLGLGVGLGASLLLIAGCRGRIPRDRGPVAVARYTTFTLILCLADYIFILRKGSLKVGRAPAALNFSADTAWETDWLSQIPIVTSRQVTTRT